jgi:hypothetical protein
MAQRVAPPAQCSCLTYSEPRIDLGQMPRSVTSPIFIQCSLQRLTALFFLFPAVSRSFLRLELFGANLDEAMRPTNSAKGCLARIKAAVDLFCWIHDVADDVRPRQSTARR